MHLAITLPASFGPIARISHLRVDESHGDAYTVWVSQSMPASPSAAQVAALQQAMNPSALVADRTVTVAADGSVGVDFDLPRFAVSLVTIRRADGAIDGGLDAGGGGGSGGSSGSTGQRNSGCGCRVGDRGDDASSSAALFGIGVLVVVLVLSGRRRRSIW